MLGLRKLIVILYGIAPTSAGPIYHRQRGRLAHITGATFSEDASTACRQIAELQARGQRLVAPSLALECLHSVPLDVERDSAFIDFALPFVSFQSDLAFLKDPSIEYKKASGTDGVDIVQGLLDIQKLVLSKSFRSQYEFTTAVEQLIRGAGDQHFALGPVLNRVFVFVRDVAIVSVSPDGLSPPKLYDLEDLSLSYRDGYKPSHISKIEGAPIFEYLANYSKTTGYTSDMDAGFNILLPSPAKSATGLTIGGPVAGYLSAGSYISLPDTTTLELANGTVLSYQNMALIRTSLAGIKSGSDLHQLEIPRRSSPPLHKRTRPTTGADTPACTLRHGQNPRPPNWPKPIDEVADKWAGAYFLSGEKYNDTAVLEMTMFKSLYPGIASDYACGLADQRDFHRFIEAFVQRFRAEGKKRLVFDLSANGGGYESVLADVFDQLFPGRRPGFRYRARATPALRWIANATFGGKGTPKVGERVLDDLHGQEWPASMGPEVVKGDNFTRLLFRDVMENRIPVGTNHTMLTEPLVQPENMVVITDGDCHSTCALLVNWLRQQGVRIVAFGGRPTEAPMAAVGGTKGAGDLQWDNIQEMLVTGLNNVHATSIPTGLGLPSLTDPPLLVTDRRVNSMDVWRVGSAVPAQFEFVAAHCRLFYTFETLRDIEAMWKAAANVAWYGGKCVPGSTANEDETIGSKPPVFKEALMPATTSISMTSYVEVEGQTQEVRRLEGVTNDVWDKMLVFGDLA